MTRRLVAALIVHNRPAERAGVPRTSPITHVVVSITCPCRPVVIPVWSDDEPTTSHTHFPRTLA